jgi:hypothetical protein
MTSMATNVSTRQGRHWYQPRVSPEHGVYVAMLETGASLVLLALVGGSLLL